MERGTINGIEVAKVEEVARRGMERRVGGKCRVGKVDSCFKKKN